MQFRHNTRWLKRSYLLTGLSVLHLVDMFEYVLQEYCIISFFVRIGLLFRCLGFPKLDSAPNSSLIVSNKMNYKTLINCFDWCLPFVLFWRDHTDQAEGRELILRRSVTGRLTDCVPLWSNSYLLNTGDILKYFEVSVNMSDDVPYWKYFVDWVRFIQYMRLS